MKVIALVSTLMILLFCACDKEETNSPPPVTDLPYQFMDGFETADNDLNQLFPADASRWSNVQLVNPANGENMLELSGERSSEGNTSLRLVAQPSDDVVSKANIEKGGFFAPLGSTVTIEADFYVTSSGSLSDLFLIDLECCSCWDDSVPDNQCPGIRLKFGGEADYLTIERGKILGTTITQSQVTFPRDEWVTVIWEMNLSPDSDGENKLTINGQTVIDETGKNLPNKDELREAFATNGIDFELQEPQGYERVQVGATANASDERVEVFVDNFKLSVEE